MTFGGSRRCLILGAAIVMTAGCNGVVDSRSPDFEIVFAEAPTNSALEVHLYLGTADGATVRRLTELSGAARHPTWSPDGRRIVFAHWAAPDSAHIAVIDADGTNLTSLTTGPRDRAPAWSSDGTRIAFLRRRESADEIAVLELGTGAVTPVPEIPGWNQHVSWTPDGQRLTYVAASSGEHGLFVVQPGESGAILLFTDDYILAPRWSPDGTRIAYVGASLTVGESVVVVRDADGGNRRVFPAPPNPGRVSWAPDGRRLVVDDWTYPLPHDIVVLDVETGASTNLTNGAFLLPMEPDWRPRR